MSLFVYFWYGGMRYWSGNIIFYRTLRTLTVAVLWAWLRAMTSQPSMTAPSQKQFLNPVCLHFSSDGNRPPS